MNAWYQLDAVPGPDIDPGGSRFGRTALISHFDCREEHFDGKGNVADGVRCFSGLENIEGVLRVQQQRMRQRL